MQEWYARTRLPALCLTFGKGQFWIVTGLIVWQFKALIYVIYSPQNILSIGRYGTFFWFPIHFSMQVILILISLCWREELITRYRKDTVYNLLYLQCVWLYIYFKLCRCATVESVCQWLPGAGSLCQIHANSIQ